MNATPAIERYFWDVNFEKLDADRDAGFIIARILEYGDIPAGRWLLDVYSTDRIKEVLRSRRALSEQSGRFWQQYFNLAESDIACFQKSSQTMPVRLWPPSVRAGS